MRNTSRRYLPAPRRTLLCNNSTRHSSLHHLFKIAIKCASPSVPLKAAAAWLRVASTTMRDFARKSWRRVQSPPFFNLFHSRSPTGIFHYSLQRRPKGLVFTIDRRSINNSDITMEGKSGRSANLAKQFLSFISPISSRGVVSRWKMIKFCI